MRFNNLSDYKEALTHPPVASQAVLALNSFIFGWSLVWYPLPPVISEALGQLPQWVLALFFLSSGMLSFVGLNIRLISNWTHFVNHALLLFVWVWLAVISFTHNSNDAFRYMPLFPVLTSFWIMVHAMLFNDNYNTSIKE